MRKLLYILTAICSTNSLLQARDVADYPEPGGTAASIRQIIDAALKSGEQKDLYEVVEQLQELAPIGSPIADQIARLENGVASNDLQNSLQKISDLLSFAPLAEAELPKDFPTYTPVGLIETKTYPEQRLAVANDFMTLFRHISTNSIAMTTPVQMEYKVSDQRGAQQESMAFFYASPEIGEAGDQGSVSVIDKGPVEVVSLGIRGEVSPRIIRDAQARLEMWVSAHDEYKVEGPLRVMGYNSPMVDRGRQFHEVQLPLKKVQQ